MMIIFSLLFPSFSLFSGCRQRQSSACIFGSVASFHLLCFVRLHFKRYEDFLCNWLSRGTWLYYHEIFNLFLNRPRLLRLGYGIGARNTPQAKAAAIAHHLLRRPAWGAWKGFRQKQLPRCVHSRRVGSADEPHWGEDTSLVQQPTGENEKA